MKECKQCKASFEVTGEDRQFYEKLDLPDPQKCPACRMRLRISFRNFFNLYRRKCDLTGKPIISMYDEQVPFPVYEMHEWWTDKWDPLDYGRDYDFNRPFFDQMKELADAVPRMNVMNSKCENSDYSNFSMESRNTYLLFGNIFNENCCYGHIVWRSKDCYDCLYLYRCECCYECVDCFDCFNLAFCQSCENCSDSRFLLDCASCRNCFGCVGLKNKEYFIFNEPYDRKSYEAKMKEFNTGSFQSVSVAQSMMSKLKGSHAVKHFHGINCENVTGDYLYNCKNVFESYDAKNCEDCRYMATAESFFNSRDINYSPAKSEFCCNCISIDGYRLRNCHNALRQSAYLDYCEDCYSSRHCFGCMGLKNKEYCILNKQYSKKQYEELMPKIVEHMRRTGATPDGGQEWGEFFPARLSPFAYNETMAHEYFPLNREEALALGYRWKEKDIQQNKQESFYVVPDDIQDVGGEVLKQVLKCEVSGRPYKITPQELKYLRAHNLPLPRRCWEQRHEDRMKLKNPRRLRDRKCGKCGAVIQTTYAPDRPEKVYCETCYLKEVY